MPEKNGNGVTEINEAAEALLKQSSEDLARALEDSVAEINLEAVGTVVSIGYGVARVRGLAGVESEELVLFEGNVPGMVLDFQEEEADVILLGESDELEAGSEVNRTGSVITVPVGDDLIGRIVDPVGQPLDNKGPLRISQRLPVEREAPGIMDRAPVTEPLQTGLKVVDDMIPVGRGQRELIVGDRQTGKTAIAVDTIINQRDGDVISIYCAIGKRGPAVAGVIDDLRAHGALDSSIVIATTADQVPGLQFLAPYAATSVGEYFMEKGRDVLIVYDDLTCHARAYREICLLMRRPPGREAYPGDIFYIHSRLLERSTHLKEDLGGGSLTALPIIETEAQNISGYIPTNLISITDGQIYLSPDLFRKGVLPAIDVGRSVSRVGGKTQLQAYRGVVGDLKLAYSQFEELERFARFGTRLDEESRRTLNRGRRVREALKQPQYHPIPVPEQIAVLLAVNEGLLDKVSLEEFRSAEKRIRDRVRRESGGLWEQIQSNQELTEDSRQTLVSIADTAIR
ncbi:MAG: alternate F1F0 ATPase, F1 subunit alpha [Deltaproteobacteria bacterium]